MRCTVPQPLRFEHREMQRNKSIMAAKLEADLELRMQEEHAATHVSCCHSGELPVDITQHFLFLLFARLCGSIGVHGLGCQCFAQAE